MMEKNTCWCVGKMLKSKGGEGGMCKGGEGGDVQMGRAWGCAKGEREHWVTFQTHSYNVSSCQLTICDKDRAIPGRVRGV